MTRTESAINEILAALDNGNGADLIRQLAQLCMQDLIEAEATEVIGAERWERTIDRIALYKSLAKTGVTRVERHRHEVPQCLQHGDFRLDNLFFNTDGSVAAAIDWQTESPGPAVLDVGYFLVSSLPADAPESVVDELLAGFHAELVANGVDDYPLDQFLTDYIDGLLIVLHRLTGLAELVDFGDGRGVELLAAWLRRLDARLQCIPA